MSPHRWMLYGASGMTGTLIAENARRRGHRPLIAGRSPTGLAELAQRLELERRAFSLDDPATIRQALATVDLVLNAAGPFLHTAGPLAQACLDTGTHYLDISNELRVFSELYSLHARAEAAHVAIVPGVGFGVVATNCIAKDVSIQVGGAQRLEVATRAEVAHNGQGAAATIQANLPYGGWIRRDGKLKLEQLGTTTLVLEAADGPLKAIAVPTGDLEAAFRATGAPDITAYSAELTPAVQDVANDTPTEAGCRSHHSFAWARATGADGLAAEAWLHTGEAYQFTADAAIRAVEEIFNLSPAGALSPAQAFGTGFAFTIDGTRRSGQAEQTT